MKESENKVEIGMGQNKDCKAMKMSKKLIVTLSVLVSSVGFYYAFHDGIHFVVEELVKAEEQDHQIRMYNSGLRCYNGDGIKIDMDEAVKCFRGVAEYGHAGAQFLLGRCYYRGEGVSVDKAEAVKWYRKAAQSNALVRVDQNFSDFFETGDDVRLFCQAAERGSMAAQFSLGLCYYNGEGVPVDKEEAIKWFCKAAERGDADAQFFLFNCYIKGESVAKDMDEAMYWLHKAATQGNPFAIEEQKKIDAKSH